MAFIANPDRESINGDELFDGRYADRASGAVLI